jgi:hypothetical protein
MRQHYESAAPSTCSPPGPARHGRALVSKIAEEIAHRAAREGKMKLNGSSVTATVGIGRRGDGRFGFEVALAIKLDGIERAEAEAWRGPPRKRSVHIPARSGATSRCMSRWSNGRESAAAINTRAS